MSPPFRRKRNRLENYDYRDDGTYYITICTKDKKCVLGHIAVKGTEAVMVLSERGSLVRDAVNNIGERYPFVHVDRYVIMPNHVHLLIELRDAEMSVSAVIGGFKSDVTRSAGEPVWQKSFYDHIVRDDEDYDRICEYIEQNPEGWLRDPLLKPFAE